VIGSVKHRLTVPLVMLVFASAAGVNPAAATTKDQSRLPMVNGDLRVAQQNGEPAAPAAPAEPQGEDLRVPGATDLAAPEAESVPDEMSLGEIPVIRTVELTEDAARRSIDAYAAVKDKYSDANLEEFENLEDFVNQAPEGKNFEADIKSYGFNNVTEWNTTITTVGFAYSALTDDQTPEIMLQVDEIEKDTSIAQDMKDQMVSSLKAMIPSENNKKIAESLASDPAYQEKLKLLAEQE
jgi:hypothetical protein